LDEHSYLVEFDASLTGIGLLLYRWVPGQHTWAPFGGAPPISIEHWEWAGKPEMQNTAEFVACVLGITLLFQQRVYISSVSLRGDSVTAGSWGLSRRARSLTALNAAVVYTLVMVMRQKDAVQYHLIKSEQNWRCDLLSRQGSWEELISRDSSWTSVRPRQVKGLQQLLTICNPKYSWVATAKGWDLARRTVQDALN
jgi:hypothetical protein